MSTRPNKVQMSVRLEPAVRAAALAVANRTGQPLAVVVADAAKRTLIKRDDAQLASGMEQVAKQLTTQINQSRDQTLDELHILKEMLGLMIRTYLNHTAPVPESERDAASRSGRARFVRLLQRLESNLGRGGSVFDELTVIEEGVPAFNVEEATHDPSTPESPDSRDTPNPNDHDRPGNKTAIDGSPT